MPQGHDLERVGLRIEAIDEFAMQGEFSDRTFGRSLLTWRAFEMVGKEVYVRANFDVPQMIDYAAVTALSQHIDSASKNFYAYLPNDTGKWRLIPWDLDHTWGNTCCPVFSDFVTPAEPGDKVNLMLDALLAVDDYEAQYFVRVKEFRDQLLAPGLLEGIFDT
jgi:hypothetical protein